MGTRDEEFSDNAFSEYKDDAFCRGWDYQARKLGNTYATRKSPPPGTVDYFFRGQALALRVFSAFSRKRGR